jgi:uncharacterized membrane protein
MSMKNALIASAVASLFMSGAAVAKAKTSKKAAGVVKCAGINECKGQGACSGADNSCKSKNDCKGKGWTETASAKACEAKGGKVLADAKKKM